MGETDRRDSGQRREYFRAEIKLSLLITNRPSSADHRRGAPFFAPAEDGVEHRILPVRDLSAGGCRCEATDEWPQVGDQLTGHLYLDDARGPLELDLYVSRREDPPDDEDGVSYVGFRFVGMRESKRQRIMRALFREYRRQRRAARKS